MTSELASKQLSMSIGIEQIQALQAVVLPAGYQLRTYRVGDAVGWIKLLAAAGFEGWNEDKFTTYMQERERIKGSYVISYNGEPVAATFASHRRVEPMEGALDYVVCHPDHRNRKLGHAVCAAVLLYLGEQQYQVVSLATDDWRLAAIKLYLNLGFRPLINRVDMPLRWETVYLQLFGAKTEDGFS